MSTVFATVSTPGPPGAAGPPGYSPKFIVASGPPGAGTGNNGDMYIDSSNGNVYGPKTAGAWGAIVANIKGPTGPTGATGYSPQYIVAAGAPAAGTGNNGDMYIDSSTSNVYGPKTAGAWGAVACNIKGSPGTAGAQGPPGVAYTPRGAWSAAVTYAQGDEVTDVSVLYIALQGSNLNHVPASSPTWWQPVGTGGSAQTPWLSNIDGGGFTLQHVAAINVGNTVTPVAPVHVVGSFSGAAFPGIVVANSSPTVGSSVAVTFAVGNTGSTVTGAISNLAESATAAAIVFSTYNSGLLERVRITAAGAVGIGTSSPSGMLTVVGPDNAPGTGLGTVQVSGGDQAHQTRIGYNKTSDYGWLQASNGSAFTNLILNGAGGNVGIGTTAPNAHLGIDTPYSAAVTHAIFSCPYVNANDYQQLLFSYAQTDASSQAGIRGIRYATGDYGASLAFVCSSNLSPGTLTERMRITAAGNVGINTTTGATKLHVAGPSGAPNASAETGIALFQTADLTELAIGGISGGNYAIWLQTKYLSNNGATWPLLLNPVGGTVGIGVTVPQGPLHVGPKGTVLGTAAGATTALASTDANLLFYLASTANWAGIGTDGNGTMWFRTGTSGSPNAAVVIGTAGFVGIGNVSPTFWLHLGNDSAAKPATSAWTVPSDLRLKRDVRPFAEGLETLVRLRPIAYTYNGEDNTPDGVQGVGLIAQEAAEVIPSCIRRTPGKIAGKSTEVLGLNSGDLTWMIVNALRQIDERLKALEKTA